MLSLVFALAAQAATAPGPARAADGVPRRHCDAPWQQGIDITPRGRGPLRPLAIDCTRPAHGGPGAPHSPDGRHIAALGLPEGTIRLFRAGEEGAPVTYDTGVGGFMTFGPGSPPAFAWSSDSRFLWAVRQTRARPGWALTPLRPIRLRPDGSAEDLPELRHPTAGGLDGLVWLNGDGLALAQFGTRGGLYRPERADPDPTLAIVDAARGRILHSLPIASLWPLTGIENREPGIYGLGQVVPVLLPDGRLRVLFAGHRNWILWTQGEAPRRLANTPIAGITPQVAFDGRRILVMRPFRPEPGDPEVVITSCRGPNCRPPRDPRERDWAVLYDIDRGDVVWRLRRSADAGDTPLAPSVISPDGRYALIGLEPGHGTDRRAALISMRDGRILQTIPATYTWHIMGFARAGRRAWLEAGNHTALYEVR